MWTGCSSLPRCAILVCPACPCFPDTQAHVQGPHQLGAGGGMEPRRGNCCLGCVLASHVLVQQPCQQQCVLPLKSS